MASTQDPVAEADQRVERAKASLKSRIALLERRLGDVRERVDVVAHIRRHPLPAVGIALALGILAAGRGSPAPRGGATERTLAGAAAAAIGALALRLARELAIGQLSDVARRWWEQHGGAPGELRPKADPFFDG